MDTTANTIYTWAHTAKIVNPYKVLYTTNSHTTVQVNKEVTEWIKLQNSKYWNGPISMSVTSTQWFYTFTLHNHLYDIMVLKWQN